MQVKIMTIGTTNAVMIKPKNILKPVDQATRYVWILEPTSIFRFSETSSDKSAMKFIL
jgi:hypothetical protein